MKREFIELDKVTIDILKSPHELTSDSYIKAYNYIYNYCTQPNNKYEILGRKVYDNLLDVVNIFTDEIVIYKSLDELYEILRKFSLSIKKIQFVYSYLSRYFIKTCIDQRDGYVMDIKTLMYNMMYRNFIEKYEKNIVQTIISEIECLKDKGRVVFIRRLIYHFKEVLLNSDESNKFHSFMKLYATHFSSKIKFKKPNDLMKICLALERRNKITQALFETIYIPSIKKRFISNLDLRKDELIDLIIDEMKLGNKTVELYKFLIVLEYTNEFVKQFGNHISEHISQTLNKENFESWKKISISSDSCEKNTLKMVLDSYRFYTLYINTNFESNIELKEVLDNHFKNYDLSTYENECIDYVNIFMNKDKEKDKISIQIVAKFICLFENIHLIEKMMLHDLEKRLLFDNADITNEYEFLEFLDENKFQDFINKAKRCLKDIEKSDSLLLFNPKSLAFFNKFKKTDYKVLMNKKCVSENNASVEFVLLYQGFWKINSCEFKLTSDLERIKNVALQNCRKDVKTTQIKFNYDLSPVIVEFKGFQIKMDTKKYCILSMIEKYDALTLKRLEEILEYDCKSEVEILSAHKIIIQYSTYYILNKKYDQGSLNLFKEKYELKQKPQEIKPNESFCKLIWMQSKIMEKLKRNKTLKKERLTEMFDKEDEKLVESVFKDLESKEFISINEDIVKYIP